MSSDAATVATVLSGRREAFADLVRRYEAAVFAVAVSVLRDRDEAQDVCQDTFVTAYRKLATLREPAKFGCWIMTMARNQALTRARLRPSEQPLENLSEAAACRDEIRQDERTERLLAAVTALPEHERIAVMLKYFGDHSLEEIAMMTGRPIGTIGAQLHRARAHLREALEEVEP